MRPGAGGGGRASAYIWVITLSLVLLALVWVAVSLTASQVRSAHFLAGSAAAASLAESGAEYGASVLYPYLYHLAKPEDLPEPSAVLARAQSDHPRPFGGELGEHGYSLEVTGPLQVGSNKYLYYVEARAYCGRAVRRARVALQVTFENGVSRVEMVERRQL